MPRGFSGHLLTVCREISALGKTSWSREHLKWDLKNEVYLNRENTIKKKLRIRTHI